MSSAVAAATTCTLSLGAEAVQLPPGCYLVIRSVVPLVGQGEAARVARDLLLGAVATIRLRYPSLLSRLIEEGTLSPGPSLSFASPLGATITTGPGESAEEILQHVVADLGTLDRLHLETRDRFFLAARCYVRACQIEHPTDRFLQLWFALEAHPGQGKKVVPRTLDYLKDALGLETPKGELKDRLGLGTIAGLRNRIVHNGLVVTAPELDDATNRLQAIVATCLRLLAGFEHGGDLARDLARYLVAPPG